MLSGDQVDTALLAIANFVDLKSPYTLGHAGAVADLAAETGVQLGLRGGRGAHACDVPGSSTTSGGSGSRTRSGTSRGPLGAGEWERVRLHPYLTERMLHQSPSLSPLGAIAVQHRERLDGSGYPQGLSGPGHLSRRADPRRGGRLPGDA